ncbi:MAG: ribosome maturation factor RimP [Ruminococcaceae bacterium]|jgi:ribosome maturation factor RimP|nr:ribosome maturation factor RimP [Oscillospiraceae bacterium]
MTTKELVKKVWDKAAPLCEENGLTLWDVTFEKEGRSYYLNVFIDRDEGVWIEDCETISRALDPFLDEKQFDSLPGYTLNVSSAGLERRLTRPEHFAWALEQDVDVSFYKAREGVTGITGTLKEKDGDRLVLEQNGNLLELSMADVAAVRLHFEI